MDPHLLTPLITFLFIALYGGIVFLAFRWSRNLLGRRAQSVADALAAAGAGIVSVRPAPGVWQPAVAELTLHGRPVTVKVQRYSRDWLLFSIAVPSPPLPHILVRAERASDRLGKRMGFNREVQIGDAPFDEAAFIDTAESDDVVRRLLERPDVRAAVLAVLATGYRVEMSPEGLKATRLQMKLTPIDTAPLPAVVAALEALAPVLPTVAPTSLGRPHWVRSPAAIFIPLTMMVISMGIGGVLAGAGVIHPVVARIDILYGFMLGFALWLGTVIGLFFLLRGGTRALGQFILAAFLLLCGVPLLGTMLAFAANSALDGSPAVTHSARVIKLSTSRKSTDATFESWRPDHDKLVIGMPRARYKTLHVGDTVEVVTHAGALGWEWVEEFR